MAARALKDLDDAVPPLTRAFTMEIRAVHRDAGSPSFTLLDTRNVLAGRGTLAKSTLSRILTPDPAAKDQSLPAWSYYEGLLYALGVDPALFQERWQAAQEEWQARARGETADLPVVLQSVSVGGGLPGSVLEREPKVESTMAPHPVTRLVTVGQKHSLTVFAAIVGSAAVVLAVGAFAFIGGSRSQSQPQPSHTASPAKAHQPTAVLVTAKPPKTLTGKIVRTWNQDANNGRGGTIGVLVFPTPYALNGSTGPHHDGDIVEVVCHTPHGRLIHERLDTNRVNSTGWFEIYYEDRLWWVPDHYISVEGGAQVPNCG
jgi:hypothetical protein